MMYISVLHANHYQSEWRNIGTVEMENAKNIINSIKK